MPRFAPAGVRHAVPVGGSATECGHSIDELYVFDELEWPGDRGAIVCSACALAVVDAINAQLLDGGEPPGDEA